MTAPRTIRLVYSVTESAELLGISRSTAYELVARGELATVRIGRRRMVTRPTLTALLGVEPPLPADLDDLRRVPQASLPPDPVRMRSTSPRLSGNQASTLPFRPS